MCSPVRRTWPTNWSAWPGSARIHYPPNADDIDDDVRTITHGTCRYTPEGSDDVPDAEIDDDDGDRVLKAPRMDIGHVEHFLQSNDRSIHLHFHGALDAESMTALARATGTGASVAVPASDHQQASTMLALASTGSFPADASTFTRRRPVCLRTIKQHTGAEVTARCRTLRVANPITNPIKEQLHP